MRRQRTTEQQLKRIEDSITALEVHVDLLREMADLDDETLDEIEKECGKLGTRLMELKAVERKRHTVATSIQLGQGGAMTDIMQRLRDIFEGDHERGCQGREYACTCGWDQRCWDTAKEAEAEIERLRREMANE